MGVCNSSMYCCTLLYVHSSIAIILMGKRELIALLNLSSWCLVMVEWLFLAVPRGCLQFVIVVFPDHTHLLFLLEPGLNSLKTAPFTADTLFGGRIQAAVMADREDQIHASLARSNVGPRPGAFKRPAPKSPAQGPAAKKAKKNTFFNRRSSIPPPAPRRPSLYQRPPGKGSKGVKAFSLQGRPF